VDNDTNRILENVIIIVFKATI